MTLPARCAVPQPPDEIQRHRENDGTGNGLPAKGVPQRDAADHENRLAKEPPGPPGPLIRLAHSAKVAPVHRGLGDDKRRFELLLSSGQ